MRTRRVLVPVVSLAAALTWILAQGIGENLVYYQTPAEIRAEPSGSTDRVRVGGQVVRGSIVREPGAVRFALTDQHAVLPVVFTGDTPAMFQENQGAIVEGTFGADRVMHADTLLIKHGDRYRPPDDARG